MSNSVLFQGTSLNPEKLPVSVEAIHNPDALASASGLWISHEIYNLHHGYA